MNPATGEQGSCPADERTRLSLGSVIAVQAITSDEEDIDQHEREETEIGAAEPVQGIPKVPEIPRTSVGMQ